MTGSSIDGPLDVGLAAERTALAWTRSALALGAAGALLARLSIETPVPELGFALAGADALLAAVLWWREDRMRRDRQLALMGHGFVPDVLLLRLVAAATFATALCGIALTLLH